MTDSRKWEYTLSDIAEMTDQSINTVRDHKQEGRFDPDNLKSVAAYISSKLLAQSATKQTVTGGQGSVRVDAWGEPIRPSL